MLNKDELNDFVKLVYNMDKKQREQAKCWMQGICKLGFYNNELKLIGDE